MHKRITSAYKHAAKFIVSLFKPTTFTLVFLLGSLLMPQPVGETHGVTPTMGGVRHFWSEQFSSNVSCFGIIGTVGESVVASSGTFKEAKVGLKAVTISQHAALRMAERGVNLKMVQHILHKAEPFKYFHAGKTKIGYYDSEQRIFIAVAHRTGNIITVITHVPQQYILKIIKKALP